MKFLIIDTEGANYAQTDNPELAKKLADRWIVIDTERNIEIGGKFGADIPVERWDESWDVS